MAPVDISVVIPSFERTELALETVQSVLDQTRPVREIVIVANGSDEHAAFWEARAGGRLRVIRESRQGQQVARNAGIHAASSSWVAILDDDDIYEPGFIEGVVPAIEDGRADIVGVDHRKFRPDRDDRKTNFEHAPRGYWKGLRPSDPNAEWTFVGRFPVERLLRRIPIYPSTTVMRRDFALGIGGYDPAMKGIRSEDIEFLIRALTYGQLTIVWRPLVRYRVHDGNYSYDRIGRKIGKWMIFEFVRTTHPHLSEDFIEALDRDLPRRRREVFRLAHRSGDLDLMNQAWAKLEGFQRTPDLFLRRIAARRLTREQGFMPCPQPGRAG